MMGWVVVDVKLVVVCFVCLFALVVTCCPVGWLVGWLVGFGEFGGLDFP